MSANTFFQPVGEADANTFFQPVGEADAIPQDSPSKAVAVLFKEIELSGNPPYSTVAADDFNLGAAGELFLLERGRVSTVLAPGTWVTVIVVDSRTDAEELCDRYNALIQRMHGGTVVDLDEIAERLVNMRPEVFQEALDKTLEQVKDARTGEEFLAKAGAAG